jgi:hypothetical protein
MQDGYLDPASTGISFQEKAYRWSERCLDFFNEFASPSNDPTKGIGQNELEYDIVNLPNGSFGTVIPGFGEDANYRLFKMLEEGIKIYQEGRRFENVHDKTSGELLEGGMAYLNDLIMGISAKFDPIRQGDILNSEKYVPAIQVNIDISTEERKKYWTASCLKSKNEGNMEAIEKPEYTTSFTNSVNSWVDDMEFFALRYMEGNEIDSSKIIQRNGYETLKWFGEDDPEEFAELIERGTGILNNALIDPHVMDDGEFWDPFGDLYVSESLTKRFENAVTKLAKLYGKCSDVPMDGCDDVSVISRIKRGAGVFSPYQKAFVAAFEAYTTTFEDQPNKTELLEPAWRHMLEQAGRAKYGMPDSDFRILIADLKEQNDMDKANELERDYKDGLRGELKKLADTIEDMKKSITSTTSAERLVEGNKVVPMQKTEPSNIDATERGGDTTTHFIAKSIELAQIAERYPDIKEEYISSLKTAIYLSHVWASDSNRIKEESAREWVLDETHRLHSILAA